MRTYFDGVSQGESFPLDSEPSINWNHVDGPLLTFSDGRLHWLTLSERFMCRIGMLDAESIQEQLRPAFAAHLKLARERKRDE